MIEMKDSNVGVNKVDGNSHKYLSGDSDKPLYLRTDITKDSENSKLLQ